MSQPKIKITSRIIRLNNRDRRVFDAEGTTPEGVSYHACGCDSAASAKRRAQAQIKFKAENPPISIEGFTLFAHDHFEFCLRFPSGSAMMFGARSADAALAHIAIEWQYRDDVIEFVRAALRLHFRA